MRRVVSVLLAVLVLSGGPAAAAPGATPVRRVLYNAGSFYPRAIRLVHNGSTNGLLLASFTTNLGPDGAGVIEASTDDGQSFQQIAVIRDPVAAHGGAIGYSSLYELPSAVGTLPAGTVLWSASAGYSAPLAHRTVRQRLWASYNEGFSWHFLSDIAVSPNQYATWEPSLTVDTAGELVAFYSDETDKIHHDQKLVQVRSLDGVHWTDYRETVVSDAWSVRPGMANVIRLPDRGYFMAYEVCNNDHAHLCGVYYRRSANGWDYGDPRDLGTVLRTPDGKYARHTPTVVWSPGPGPNGTILITSEMLVNNDGSIAPGNGRTILGNDNLGAGTWYELPAPIAVDGVNNTNCKNFSPTLVPSTDGGTVLEIVTDLDHSICKTYYATGPLVSGKVS